MKNGIIDLCKQIEDPSMNRKRVHKMETSIYISIAAVICGAQSWNEIEEFGNSKMTFFKQNRNVKTAITTQLADMLILTIFRKSSLMLLPPFGSGRSSAALRQVRH